MRSPGTEPAAPRTLPAAPREEADSGRRDGTHVGSSPSPRGLGGSMRSFPWRAGALVAAAVVGLATLELRWHRREGAEPPVLAPAVVEVAPGVHLLGRTFPNAAYLVETTDGLVLVDTCPDADAAPVLSQIRDLELDVRRLRRILLTHAHADHALGARRLRELSGASVCAGRGDCDVLRDGAPREAFFSIFHMAQREHATEIDVALDGGEVIEVGDARFEVIATPGHTPGSVCYLLERDGLRILFTGDTVMSLTDTEPLTGPGIYPAWLSPRYRGSARDFASSLRRLRELPAPDLVLPGHPAADSVPQDPRIPEERWRGLLSRAEGKVATLLERLSKDGADFLDGSPKELIPGLHYLGNFGGAALYALTTPDRQVFLFDAPGGPGLPEFLHERWKRLGLGELRPTAVLLTSSTGESVRGLSSVVERWGCAVVAPHAALQDLREDCPSGTRLIASEAVAALGWFPVVTIPMQGLDSAAVAYAIRWKCRTVVLSGREPTRTTLTNGVVVHPTVPWRGSDPGRYLASLESLRAIDPDLWLPAVPINGQNANLYDTEWDDVLRSNRGLVR